MSTPTPDHRPEIVRELHSPRAYPNPVAEVELIETHCSWVFLAGDHVYKVKKPVDLGFLDFTEVDDRRHYCQEEVRLNRALAGDTYRGVVPVVRRPTGEIAIGGEGRVVDHAVHMRRLPKSRLLDRILERGACDNALLDRLVAVLHRFHQAADHGADVETLGSPDAIAELVRDNLSTLERFVAPAEDPNVLLAPSVHRRLTEWSEAFLQRHREILAKRMRDGRIREGHGDLHLGNICVREDGEIVIYDRIEFSLALRASDVAAELAFFAMDLDLRGYRGFARYFERACIARYADPELAVLFPFYKVYRALVRAKVAALRMEGAAGAAHPAARDEARRYVALAVSYLIPPALLLTCGLPASGKSHLARELAVPFEAVVLRTDVIRKHEARRGTLDPNDLYTPEAIAHTYGALLRRVEASIGAGRSVVVDAMFGREAQRRPFVTLAARRHCPLLLLEVSVPDAVTRERMRLRAEDADEPSDADLAVWNEARTTFESPTEIPRENRLAVDGRGDAAHAVVRVLERLCRAGD